MSEAAAGSPSPDRFLDSSDRGDDTQRRFYYQYCCIAIAIGSLIDEAPEYDCFFCEQADDLLGRLRTGKFVAIQIKSKEKAYGPATTEQTEFKSWIDHFCKLEIRFPAQFERYILMFSNGFLKGATYSSPEVYREKLSNCDLAKPKKPDTKALLELAKHVARPAETIQAVLRNAFQDVPELTSIKPVVWKRHFLGLLPNAGTMRLDRLFGAFDLFISKIEQACNLTGDDARADRLSLYMDPAAVQTDIIISGKRIDTETLRHWLEDCIDHVPVLFSSYSPKSLGDIAVGTENLLKKFTAGLIDLDNYQMATELKGNAEEAFLALRHHLNDADKAQQVYNSLRLLVQNRCKEAWDEQIVEHNGAPFGTKMLVNVRKRLDALASTAIPDDYKGVLVYEHLLGLAYMLTEECVVWWSPKFDMGES